MDIRVVTKISCKSAGFMPSADDFFEEIEVGGKKEKRFAESRRFGCMIVYGTLRSAEIVNTSYGDSIRFKGDFQAINKATGEVTNAPQMFLPRAPEGVLDEAFSRLDGDTPMSFTLDIDVVAKKNERGGAPYEFDSKFIGDAKESDPHAEARKAAMARLAPQVRQLIGFETAE